MNKNYASINLFKKHREVEGADLDQPIKSYSPNIEQKAPESIIQPLELEEGSSGLNSEQSLFPNIMPIIQTVLRMLGSNSKDNFVLELLKDKDIKKWPIWSLFKNLK